MSAEEIPAAASPIAEEAPAPTAGDSQAPDGDADGHPLETEDVADGEAGEDEEGPEFPPAVDLHPDMALPFLATAEIEIIGRLVAASNTTLLVALHGDVPGRRPVTAGAVYKPIRGERPLWDFPDGTLAGREVAAYRLSAATGWDIVPPTILREDGPVGPGMLQLWVETRDDADIADLVRAADPRLRRIVIFDAIANNADRKGGHLLVRPDGRIQGVDHGVTFSPEPKLRTILWGWRGTKLAQRELTALVMLHGRWQELADGLAAHLTAAEIDATRVRLRTLLRTGLFPQPSPNWPPVPWPWY